MLRDSPGIRLLEEWGITFTFLRMLFAEVSSLVQPAFLARQIRWLHRIYMVWRPFSERGAKACWEMNGTAVAWDVWNFGDSVVGFAM